MGYFIGSPGMNVLPAEINGQTARVAGNEIALGRTFDPKSGAKVEIGVRPEFGRLSASEGIPVKIERVDDVGAHRIVRARLDELEVNVVLDEAAEIAADANRIKFEPEAVHVYADGWIIDSRERAERLGGGAAA